jgi:hypothetical protein
MKHTNVKQVMLREDISGRGGQMKRVKEGEYGQCIFYMYMNMEH